MHLVFSPNSSLRLSCFFFFNDTATTEIYTLSLHDALPISTFPATTWASPQTRPSTSMPCPRGSSSPVPAISPTNSPGSSRSEEHTSELQSQSNLVCRLLLEKKKKKKTHSKTIQQHKTHSP